MERTPIREDGLVGTLFHSRETKNAVICLGGSNGGLPEERAEILARHGFTTLALAYFAYEGLPPTLNQIPLEYFEKAIERMFSESGIEKVALWGGSRGGELALLLGTLFPSMISAIAAHVPSSVVFGSFPENSPAWTYRGTPVTPIAPFQFSQKITGSSEQTAISMTHCFLKSMEDREAYKAAQIPVEKLECPLLLISAGDDRMWPSKLFAEQVEQRLMQYQSPIQCTHYSYKDVGHAPSKGESGFHPIFDRWFAFGGKPEENKKAAGEWIEKTIDFFKESL